MADPTLDAITQSLRSTGILGPEDSLDGDAPFAAINMARDMAGAKNTQLQNILAPMEHQAYARQVVQDHPIIGTIGLLPADLAYNAAKGLGLVKARSDGSTAPQDIAAVFRGIVSGLAGYKAKGE